MWGFFWWRGLGSVYVRAGTVQFRDGNIALEASVPVFNGFAFIITRGLTAVGTHRLTAILIPPTEGVQALDVEHGDGGGTRRG